MSNRIEPDPSPQDSGHCLAYRCHYGETPGSMCTCNQCKRGNDKIDKMIAQAAEKTKDKETPAQWAHKMSDEELIERLRSYCKDAIGPQVVCEEFLRRYESSKADYQRAMDLIIEHQRIKSMREDY